MSKNKAKIVKDNDTPNPDFGEEVIVTSNNTPLQKAS